MTDSSPGTRPATNIPWVDRLPASWDACRLKFLLARSVAGGTPSTVEPGYWANGTDGLPWVAIGDMSGEDEVTITEKRVTAEGVEAANLRPLEPGTILYAMYASVGEVAILGVRGATNQAILGLVPDTSSIDEDFLRWWLEDVKRNIRYLTSTTTQDNLNAEKVGNIPVALPPRDEQQSIADFLDEKTAGIDRIVEDKKRLIERLQEKRQALIDYAVSGGLTHAAEQKEPTASWLPALPPEWNTTRIKHIAKSRIGSFTDGDWVESPYITDSGVRLIQTGNIGVGRYREQGFRYISESSFDELSCTEVRPGDILICRLADPVGRACQAPDLGGRMITAVDVAILKPRPEHDSRFLVYFFSSTPYLKWVERISRGGTRDRISRSMLGNVKVPTPPRKEQRRIADYLDKECGEIDAVVEDLDEQIARLHEYRSSLITAAVTGQIDVRVSTPAVA